MTHVRYAAVLVIALFGGQSFAPVTCPGWEGDAASRKACCQRAHHDHAQDQSAADDCCAKHQSIGTVATVETNAVATMMTGLADSPSVGTMWLPLSPLPVSGFHRRSLASPHLNSPPLRR
jgi:hypothetical protein